MYKLNWIELFGDVEKREDEEMRVGMMSRVSDEEGGWMDKGEGENLKGTEHQVSWPMLLNPSNFHLLIGHNGFIKYLFMIS